MKITFDTSQYFAYQSGQPNSAMRCVTLYGANFEGRSQDLDKLRQQSLVMKFGCKSGLQRWTLLGAVTWALLDFRPSHPAPMHETSPSAGGIYALVDLALAEKGPTEETIIAELRRKPIRTWDKDDVRLFFDYYQEGEYAVFAKKVLVRPSGDYRNGEYVVHVPRDIFEKHLGETNGAVLFNVIQRLDAERSSTSSFAEASESSMSQQPTFPSIHRSPVKVVAPAPPLPSSMSQAIALLPLSPPPPPPPPPLLAPLPPSAAVLAPTPLARVVDSVRNLLFEGIIKAGHIGWYRERYHGGCPQEAARKCPYLGLWQGVDHLSLLRSTLHRHLAAHSNACVTSNVASPKESKGLFSIFKAKERLCKLHQAQPAWRKRGSSCVGECCFSHVWPEKSSAPLLYTPHLSRTQAVILLHFGVWTEEAATRLVQEDVAIGQFLVHALHNCGTPEQAAIALLPETSCLRSLWNDKQQSHSSFEAKRRISSEENDGDTIDRTALKQLRPIDRTALKQLRRQKADQYSRGDPSEEDEEEEDVILGKRFP